MTLRNALAERYVSVLDRHDLRELYAGQPRLSGLFLPSVSDGYSKSKLKTMIVGKEPRSWRDGQCAGRLRHKLEMSDVEASIAAHSKTLKTDFPKSKFIQFYRHACKRINGDDSLGDSIIWANLICVSLDKKSAVQSPGESLGARVAALSKDLLRAQIEVLQPEAILFVTGKSYDRHIRDFFPEREKSMAIHPGRLWAFNLGKIRCFRTSHPQWGDGMKYRTIAIDQLVGEGRAPTLERVA